MHIIIGGFGRSGTTWLSDVISKCLGGLILFEPFHPAVFSSSEEFIYSEDISIDQIRKHLDFLRAHCPTNPWILRNHLNSPLDSHSSAFLEYVWSNSKILGYKTIRGNHCLDRLSKVSNKSKIIYIYRHPFAVLSSINKRARFWEDVGWNTHKELFFKRALQASLFDEQTRIQLHDIVLGLRSKNENIITMWALSLMISINEVELADGHIISYEELYMEPYEHVKKLLGYLGVEGKSIHPSYFFTPSMTSLRTLHHLRKYGESEVNMDQLFWKDHIGLDEAKNLKALCKNILQHSKKAFELASQSNYL